MIRESLIRKAEILWGLPIYYILSPGSEPESTGQYLMEEAVLPACPEIVSALIHQQEQQGLPVISVIQEKFFFFCLRGNSGYYLSGPFCLENLTYVEIHAFYKACGISSHEEKHPARTSLFEAVNFMSLLYELLSGADIDPMAILSANGLIEEETKRSRRQKGEFARFELQQIEEERYHHTYREECFCMASIREGNVKEVRSRTRLMMESAGTMSQNPETQMRYLCVVTATMATREAIKSGVSPTEAYRMSDYLLNHVEKLTHLPELEEYVLQIAATFTEMIAAQKTMGDTGYTEKAKNYVARNYYHKIYMQEIADSIGISQGHLSRVFHADTGMKLQDYITQYRVQQAASLLQYTDLSLAEISSYVCFPSQSHFGTVFRKYTGMTPGEYRRRKKAEQ